MSIKVAASGSQVGRQASAAPVLTLSSGTLEALKWLALVLMTFDHVNKHLLHASVPERFAAGLLAIPLFGFALGYNLARPDALADGAFKRTAARLAVFGSVARVPFHRAGWIRGGWWPFKVMATLLVATLCASLIELGGWVRIALACLLFILGGAVVGFWRSGLAACLFAWAYCRRLTWGMLELWIASLAALYVINRDLSAITTLPLVFAAGQVSIKVPRIQLGFYLYYPAHLVVL